MDDQNNQIITIDTITEIPVSERIVHYQTLLQKEVDMKKQVNSAKKEIEDFLQSLDLNAPDGLNVRSILIYEKKDERINDKNFTDFVHNTGGYMDYLLAEEDYLGKIFDDTAIAKMREISMLYHAWKSPKIDVEATNKAKETYKQLVSKHKEMKNELESVQNELTMEKNLISFVGDIANIAGASKGGSK